MCDKEDTYMENKEAKVARIIKKLIKLNEIRRIKQGVTPAPPSKSDSQ